MLINLLIFIVAGYFIMKSTELFVRGAVAISEELRIEKIFFAATIVSLVTTMPEFVVSVSSSYIGETGLAVGNAIGSCVCNLGLVLAVGGILRTIEINRKDFIQRMQVLLGSYFLIFIFSMDGVITRVEGLLLLFFMAIYLIFNYYSARKMKQAFDETLDVNKGKRFLFQNIVLFLAGGIGTVVLARYGLVDTGINIAHSLNIPPIVLGLTLTALGTSLPELFTAIVSSRRSHGEISLGNVIGASVMNLLWVLGAAALVRPLAIDRQTMVFNLPVAVFITLVLLFLGLRGLTIDRRKGLIVLCLYLLYVIGIYLFVYRQ